MLIDPGSELSFISENLVRHLQLKRTQASIPLLGIGGTYSGKTRGAVRLHLQSIHDVTARCTISAYLLNKLTTRLPTSPSVENTWPHLQGILLADPDFLKSSPVDIIIGADWYGHIIEPEIVKGNALSPVAQKSIFGWIVSGPTSATRSMDSIHGYHCARDEDLYQLLTKFWIQEEVRTNDRESLSPDEANCESHYANTHFRDN